MKTLLRNFLIESLVEDDSTERPKSLYSRNIQRNLKTCIDHNVFLYRGIERDGMEKIIHQPKLENDRSSQAASNILLNFASTLDHLPNRKRSSFITNSYSGADDFGRIFFAFPHDNVKQFAVVLDDFNLKHVPNFNHVMQISSKPSTICWCLGVWGKFIGNEVDDASNGVIHLGKLIQKINDASIENAKTIFERIDSLLIDFWDELMHLNDDVRAEDLNDDVRAEDLDRDTELHKSIMKGLEHYEKSFTKMLSALIDELEIRHFDSFEELIKFMSNNSYESFEIWYEGDTTLLNYDWITAVGEEYAEKTGIEPPDGEYHVEILKRMIRK